MTDVWASGNWVVIEGREADFISRWTEWLEWTRDTAPGFIRATLMRGVHQSRHFVSVGEWRDADSRSKWQADPGFAERLAGVRVLCEESTTDNYERAALVE